MLCQNCLVNMVLSSNCHCCGNPIFLRLCCGQPPILKHDDAAYPGAVRYECSICHRTTIPSYSTLGNSISIAAQTWNNNYGIEYVYENYNKATVIGRDRKD